MVCYENIEGDLSKKKLFNEVKYKLAGSKVIVDIEGMLSVIRSFKQYGHYVNNALREKPLCSLFYPRLNCFSRMGYDLTHQFFVLGGAKNL